MKLKAKLTVRNHAMVEARKNMGLNQVQCAKAVGMSVAYLQDLELLNYRRKSQYHITQAESLADFLGLSIDDVLPEKVRGRILTLDSEKIFESDPDEILLAYEKKMQLETAIEDRIALQEDNSRRAKQEEIKSVINDCLDTLTERERTVLELRFGLDGCGERTLEEVGRKIKVTGSRVREIEGRALHRLMHPFRAKHLKKLED